MRGDGTGLRMWRWGAWTREGEDGRGLPASRPSYRQKERGGETGRFFLDMQERLLLAYNRLP